MNSNLARAHQSIPLNSVETRCAKASIDVNRPVDIAPTESENVELSLVLEAIGQAGMQDKEFAINGRLDPGQWTRIKGGVGNLHAKVLLRQPPKFWIALDAVQRRQLGISEQTEERIRSQEIEDTAEALFQKLVERIAGASSR